MLFYFRRFIQFSFVFVPFEENIKQSNLNELLYRNYDEKCAKKYNKFEKNLNIV